MTDRTADPLSLTADVVTVSSKTVMFTDMGTDGPIDIETLRRYVRRGWLLEGVIEPDESIEDIMRALRIGRAVLATQTATADNEGKPIIDEHSAALARTWANGFNFLLAASLAAGEVEG